MMRCITALVAFILLAFGATAQITITASDMPVNGDTLRYSSASILSAITFAADSGTDMSWDYTLTPTSQGIDHYQKPGEVNPLYVSPLNPFSITNPNCYGYKVADSIPGIGLIASGITISDLHTFFSKFSTPPCFAAEAFGAKVVGLPIGASYTQPDAWYFFPLSYGRNDSSVFDLTFGAASFGSIRQRGYRKTRVDGWGTIKTPYLLSPTPCIRVRSEIVEIDSVKMDTISFGLPRTTVEYKWLVKGEHYPALWVTTISVAGVEIPVTLRYRDIYRPELTTGISNTSRQDAVVRAYPNPADGGIVNFEVPQDWHTGSMMVELFDTQGKLVTTSIGNKTIDISTLPKGNYVARLTAEGNIAYVRVIR